jgi:aminotransferase
VAYTPGITFAGGVPVLVPTSHEDGWALDPAKLEAAITPRTKALFLGYPCNPTGAVLEPAQLRCRFQQYCRQSGSGRPAQWL